MKLLLIYQGKIHKNMPTKITFFTENFSLGKFFVRHPGPGPTSPGRSGQVRLGPARAVRTAQDGAGFGFPHYKYCSQRPAKASRRPPAAAPGRAGLSRVAV